MKYSFKPNKMQNLKNLKAKERGKNLRKKLIATLIFSVAYILISLICYQLFNVTDSFKYLFFAGIFFAIPNVAFWIPSRYILFLEKEEINQVLEERFEKFQWARL
jgi:ABC-type uncharacterized transport system YnjBCD permease subunit